MPDDSPLSLLVKVDPFDPQSTFERWVGTSVEVFHFLHSFWKSSLLAGCVTFSSGSLQADQRHSATGDEGQRLPVRRRVRPQSRRLTPGRQPRGSLRCSAHHLLRPTQRWPTGGNCVCQSSSSVTSAIMMSTSLFLITFLNVSAYDQFLAVQKTSGRVVKSVSHWKPQLSITVMSEDFTFNKAGLPNDVRRYMRV